MAGPLYAQTPGSRKPNVVLIFADDQGYQDLGCYGSPQIRTPNIDALAADGVKFTDFYVAASVCSPSRAALLTGCYAPRVGVSRVLFPRDNIGLNPDEVTIADLLRGEGYATACIGKWHLGHHPEFLPTRHGFDRYYGIPYSNDMDGVEEEEGSRSFNVPLMRDEEIVERPAEQKTLTKRYTEEAVSFIRGSADEPFFLYLPHTMPHIPLYASDEFAGKSERGLYGDVIEEIDWSVGRIMATLREVGVDDNTLVIYTSDNGPWLPAGSAWPLRGSKFTTMEGGHRVPAIARWPGRISPGQVENRLCSSMDLFPTIAGLAGCPLPQDRVYDGIDIAPILCGDKTAKGHDTFYYYNGLTLEAVRQGPWKLHLPRQKESHVYWHVAGSGGRIASLDNPLLYNLEEEVGERTDLSQKRPEVMKKMLSLAEEARAELGDWNRQGKDCLVSKYKGNLNQPKRTR